MEFIPLSIGIAYHLIIILYIYEFATFTFANTAAESYLALPIGFTNHLWPSI